MSQVWLGISDSAIEDIWTCIETAHVVANKNSDAGFPGPMFGDGEPDGGVSQNCAATAKGRGYLIADVACSKARPYMCEKDQP